ncbi:MAG: hypothetical protein P8P74_12740 [Crocinitomicaceae bacterium]|nr:hypothetical protein [Crocinitomicaceae bacterium]
MDIVREKEFIELSAAERAELGELCSSEDEYNQVKAMFAGISAMDWSNPTPKAETKESLDHLFAQKHPKAAPIWYNAPLAVLAPKGKPFYRQPLVQAAAVGLLIFLAYPFMNSDVMTSDTAQVAVLEKESTSSELKEVDGKVSDDMDTSSKEDVNGQDDTSIETRSEVFTPSEFTSEPAKPVSTASLTPRDLVSAVTEETTFRKESEILLSSAGSASEPGSTHPDGIFVGDKAEIFSVPASREPAVFDLLTSTF